MREKDMEQVLVGEVKKLGGRAYKWTSPGNDGVPDRIVIFPYQRPIFVELKTDVGKLSTLQKIQCERLSNLGQPVVIVRGIHGVSQFFQDYGFEEVSKDINRKYNL
ncbi:MAG: VRR-NUC domain-containing protein [Eubacterium sp.]